jgi:YhcH/YjgK/YiaL family protein
MIVALISQIDEYFHGLEGIGEFLLSLDADTPEGRHELDGDNIFALVSRYETSPRTERKPEAHRKYVDIQFLISGQEVVEWFPLEGQKVSEPYDEDKDVAFYDRPETEGSKAVLGDGVFAVFFPQDAHMPQVRLGDSAEDVLKVVVKIKADLL